MGEELKSAVGTLDFGILDPRNALKVNRSPLQQPGKDTLIRTATVAGPDAGGDRRIFLSADLLGQLLDVARSSLTRRVQVDRAGVRVDLYQRPDGHQYEVWTLIGADPKPEGLPPGLQSAIDETSG